MTYFKAFDNKKHFAWMEKCLLCWEAAEQCITECITTGKNLNCCNICRDCAEICGLCIKFEAQQSTFFGHLCLVCADICEACAIECDKYSEHSIACKNCADACRVCVATCKETAYKSEKEVNQ